MEDQYKIIREASRLAVVTFAAFITALALLFALSLIGYGIAVLYAKFQQLFNEEIRPAKLTSNFT